MSSVADLPIELVQEIIGFLVSFRDYEAIRTKREKRDLRKKLAEEEQKRRKERQHNSSARMTSSGDLADQILAGHFLGDTTQRSSSLTTCSLHDDYIIHTMNTIAEAADVAEAKDTIANNTGSPFNRGRWFETALVCKFWARAFYTSDMSWCDLVPKQIEAIFDEELVGNGDGATAEKEANLWRSFSANAMIGRISNPQPTSRAPGVLSADGTTLQTSSSPPPQLAALDEELFRHTLSSYKLCKDFFLLSKLHQQAARHVEQDAVRRSTVKATPSFSSSGRRDLQPRDTSCFWLHQLIRNVVEPFMVEHWEEHDQQQRSTKTQQEKSSAAKRRAKSSHATSACEEGDSCLNDIVPSSLISMKFERQVRHFSRFVGTSLILTNDVYRATHKYRLINIKANLAEGGRDLHMLLTMLGRRVVSGCNSLMDLLQDATADGGNRLVAQLLPNDRKFFDLVRNAADKMEQPPVCGGVVIPAVFTVLDKYEQSVPYDAIEHILSVELERQTQNVAQLEKIHRSHPVRKTLVSGGGAPSPSSRKGNTLYMTRVMDEKLTKQQNLQKALMHLAHHKASIKAAIESSFPLRDIADGMHEVIEEALDPEEAKLLYFLKNVVPIAVSAGVAATWGVSLPLSRRIVLDTQVKRFLLGLTGFGNKGENSGAVSSETQLSIIPSPLNGVYSEFLFNHFDRQDVSKKGGAENSAAAVATLQSIHPDLLWLLLHHPDRLRLPKNHLSELDQEEVELFGAAGSFGFTRQGSLAGSGGSLKAREQMEFYHNNNPLRCPALETISTFNDTWALTLANIALVEHVAADQYFNNESMSSMVSPSAMLSSSLGEKRPGISVTAPTKALEDTLHKLLLDWQRQRKSSYCKIRVKPSATFATTGGILAGNGLGSHALDQWSVATTTVAKFQQPGANDVSSPEALGCSSGRHECISWHLEANFAFTVGEINAAAAFQRVNLPQRLHQPQPISGESRPRTSSNISQQQREHTTTMSGRSVGGLKTASMVRHGHPVNTARTTQAGPSPPRRDIPNRHRPPFPNSNRNVAGHVLGGLAVDTSRTLKLGTSSELQANDASKEDTKKGDWKCDLHCIRFTQTDDMLADRTDTRWVVCNCAHSLQPQQLVANHMFSCPFEHGKLPTSWLLVRGGVDEKHRRLLQQNTTRDEACCASKRHLRKAERALTLLDELSNSSARICMDGQTLYERHGQIEDNVELQPRTVGGGGVPQYLAAITNRSKLFVEATDALRAMRFELDGICEESVETWNALLLMRQ